jgi:hypothetical protein
MQKMKATHGNLNTYVQYLFTHQNCLVRLLHLGLYSEMGLHIDMERNFACSWRRPNCRSQVIDLSLSALIS